jgi:predicted CoA-substrate-specific enzyme activase
MSPRYGKWPESVWASGQIERKDVKRATAGVDVGTTSAQAVVFGDGDVLAYANIHTGTDFGAAADSALKQAMDAIGMNASGIDRIAATGWGGINASFADRTIDEVHCHAKGARFMFGPSATTVVDLGGQTVKAMRLYDWDGVWDFTMNDKCATGMGRNIEVMSDILQIPITEIGSLSLSPEKDPEPVSTTCYNFANTETVGLLRPGYKEQDYSEAEVLASYLLAIAWRILGTIGKLQPLDAGDITVRKELAFTGGLAKNPGITNRLERALDAPALRGTYDPQIAGALGAAILAAEAL